MNKKREEYRPKIITYKMDKEKNYFPPNYNKKIIIFLN